MKLTVYLALKYRVFQKDVAYKGYIRTLLDMTYEVYYKYRLKKKGVVFPDYSDNLAETNEKSVNKDCHENTTSSFYMLSKAFKKLPVKRNRIRMLDIGCGAGRVLAFGMQQNFEQVSGIDLDEPALEQAMHNCRQMQQHGSNTGFSIMRMDATTCKIPDTVNVLYLYNPFGMKTMQAVVDNIMQHMDTRKEDLYIIYSNPTYRELFDAYPVCNKIFQSSYKDIERADMSIFRIKSKIQSSFTKAMLLWEGGYQMILG